MKLAFSNSSDHVSLYCSHNGSNEDGRLYFYVINGGWNGSYKDGIIHVKMKNTYHDSNLVWAGECPYVDNHNEYNEAMAWIQEEISKPDYKMMPLEEILKYDPKSVKKSLEDYDGDWDDIPF